ncbi:MAG: SRPBCC domain-containing protein [Alphaproteobacteria bacterium]|nr:SRPBCC domain-containing protein [Alphaproteobacteria bacterium]
MTIRRRRRREAESPAPEPRRRLGRGSTMTIGFLVVFGALAYAATVAKGGHRLIETAIDIDAPPAEVWAVLAETAHYPDWNPFIRRIEGEFRAEARLTVEIAPPGKSPQTFRPRVLRAEPEKELRWVGSYILPMVLEGQHLLLLEAGPAGGTRLHHAERFVGLLAAWGSAELFDATRQGFEAMNRALKARVEARPRRA